MTMEFKGPAEAAEPVGAGAGATVPAAWPGFSITRLPRILFGGGTSGELGAVVREFGHRALVVVRGPGFTESPGRTRIGGRGSGTRIGVGRAVARARRWDRGPSPGKWLRPWLRPRLRPWLR